MTKRNGHAATEYRRASNGRADEAKDGPILLSFDTIEPREVRWIWKHRIPAGRVSLIAGPPGGGKTFVEADLASRISTGSAFPDGSPCQRGDVILVSAEDDPNDTLAPRLIAHHADLTRIHLLRGSRRISGRVSTEIAFDLRDVQTLRQAIERKPQTRAVFIDPIGSFLGGRVNSDRDNEVRAIIGPVGRLAEETGVAVVLVAHHRKGAGAGADELVLGSRAFTGFARAVWHLTRDQANPSRRLFLGGKNNLAPEVGGLAFTISGEGQTAAVTWEREPLEMRADDVVGDSTRGPDAELRDEAKTWLSEMLREGGEQTAVSVMSQAKAAGFSESTIRRARKLLPIVVKKCAATQRWLWGLKPQEGSHA